MPKHLSTNPKAAAARQRQEDKKQAEKAKSEKEKEDKLWKDDDKLAKRKQLRKEEKELKHEQEVQRKLEARRILEEEDRNLGGKRTLKAEKVTRAQIEAAKPSMVLSAALASSTASAKSGKEEPQVEDDGFLEENPNRKMVELVDQENIIEGRSVEQAIAALSCGDEDPGMDRHPEKRMKAAFLAYEERELVKLKSEYPGLRMSQLKQMIFKAWQKSSENPLVQAQL